MNVLFKDVIIILLIVYIISQIVLPCFVPGLEFFNLHKRKKKKAATPGSLDDLAGKATKASETYKEAKSDVESIEQKISEIKTKLND